MRHGPGRAAGAWILAGAIAGCGGGDGAAETADEFVARINAGLQQRGHENAMAGWVHATYITPDTEQLAAKAEERLLEYHTQVTKQARAYADTELSRPTRRALELLRQGLDAPAPDDPERRAELAAIGTRMTSLYGAARWCPGGPETCRNLDQLSATLVNSRDWDEQLEAWSGWHTISRPMRADYSRYVELANEGARELGYADLGQMWRSGYDMSPAEFEAETERLWSQVKPLYDGLHCYARGRLQRKYGSERVPDGAPVPAHIFGNLWAQQWNFIYDLLEPYPGASDLDVSSALKKQGYDPVRMTRSAEAFYQSLGFPALPQTFWEHSLLARPRDREVICHPSAWNMDTRGDVRLKECLQPNDDDLYTTYHELGHVYYYLSYLEQPYLFQAGAHDGFHEAVGDTVNLSVTEDYLGRIGLLPAGAKRSHEALINRQMKVATDKIAFLPFGKLIDQWRWGVFSGAIPPEQYNASWWELRRRYQGITPPVTRSEADFDPGAKYHIPANTPYTRYFLAYILQFQFHQALCDAAGYAGPLHECSIYGSAPAGRRLREMLALGASRPWQDALEKLTGTRRMDASAILDYFQPLMAWLEAENRGRPCGW